MHKSSLIEEMFMSRSWIRSPKRESLAQGALIFLKIPIHNIYRTLFLQRIVSRESDSCQMGSYFYFSEIYWFICFGYSAQFVRYDLFGFHNENTNSNKICALLKTRWICLGDWVQKLILMHYKQCLPLFDFQEVVRQIDWKSEDSHDLILNIT
jgi:hypothetical protein